jgi:hypothetical protein
MNHSRKNVPGRQADQPVDKDCDPYDTPSPQEDLDEASDLDEFDPENRDDERWDAFIADDDELDPLPDPGDFWIGDD